MMSKSNHHILNDPLGAKLTSLKWRLAGFFVDVIVWFQMMDDYVDLCESSG